MTYVWHGPQLAVLFEHKPVSAEGIGYGNCSALYQKDFHMVKGTTGRFRSSQTRMTAAKADVRHRTNCALTYLRVGSPFGMISCHENDSTYRRHFRVHRKYNIFKNWAPVASVGTWLYLSSAKIQPYP